MSKELEIEYKNMLTLNSYHQLMKQYGGDISPFKQSNYYFDTPNAILKEKGMGLRLRALPHKNEYTLKVPTENKHAMLEITDSLSNPEMAMCLTTSSIPNSGDVATYLKQMGVPKKELQLIGSLTTERLEKRLSPDVLLVLDKSTFGSVIDYELEMEVGPTVSPDFFNDFLESHGISYQPSQKKIARMLSYQQQSHSS